MRSDTPESMSSTEIISELIENATEIYKLGSSITENSWWDEAMWGLGITVGVAGVALAPPTGGLSISVTVISLVLLAADMAKKINAIRGNEQIRARVATLHQRNNALHGEILHR